jgi:GNAT superfamily N-acetyltransferase
MPKQRASQPQRRPRVSALVAPDIAVEPLANIASELTPLFVRFWQESGKDGVEIAPDWENMLRLAAVDMLQVVTVREATLLGFLLNIIQPRHLFYRDIVHASTIAYWLDPSLRTGWFPIKLFRRNLDFLRERGVKRAFIAADAAFHAGRAGLIFQRVGYTLYETHYKQVL